MIKNIKLVGLFLAAVLLGACADSDTPAETDSFNLAKLQSTAEGEVYTVEIMGSDSNGFNYGGFITISNKGQTEYDGVMITPRFENVTLEAGKAGYSNTASFYIDESGYILAIGQGEELCNPAAPASFPVTVNIGDNALLPVFACSISGNSVELSWSVEDAGNGNIQFIISMTRKDGKKDIIIDATQADYTVNATGDIIEFSGVYTRDFYTLNYSTDPDAPKTPVVD